MNWKALAAGRRWTAIVCLRFAGVILRMSMELYRRRHISAPVLRTALSAARFFELCGGRLALGRRPTRERTKEERFNGGNN